MFRTYRFSSTGLLTGILTGGSVCAVSPNDTINSGISLFSWNDH